MQRQERQLQVNESKGRMPKRGRREIPSDISMCVVQFKSRQQARRGPSPLILDFAMLSSSVRVVEAIV